jgi:predicted permease
VVAVGYSDLVPAGGSMSNEGLVIPGSAVGQDGPVTTILNTVSPGFFETYSVPILRGRGLTGEDVEGAQRTAVVNEAFVRRHFPDGTAIGRRFGFETDGPFDVEIVGVVGDFAYVSPRFGIRPAVHLAMAQDPSGVGGITFAVRHQGPVADLAEAVRRVVRRVDPSLPVFSVRTQREQLDTSLVRERIFASLAAGLGVVALALACVGLYGLLSYSVLRRTHEIGIRMALGARGSHVLRLIGGELVPVVIGLLLGLLGAWFATGALGSLLFGLAPMDPLAVGAAVTVLLTVAIVAGMVPARRAACVEPVEALRTE